MKFRSYIALFVAITLLVLAGCGMSTTPSTTKYQDEDLRDMGYGHSNRYKRLNKKKHELMENGYIESTRYRYARITERGIEYLKIKGVI
ncbi:MAG: hypothetical protein GX244_07555 [Firmicutes bacterium]|jgi:repressor of nif and glnA expression|nr:hypothetical protein [Bacillota bacterium]